MYQAEASNDRGLAEWDLEVVMLVGGPCRCHTPPTSSNISLSRFRLAPQILHPSHQIEGALCLLHTCPQGHAPGQEVTWLGTAHPP